MSLIAQLSAAAALSLNLSQLIFLFNIINLHKFIRHTTWLAEFPIIV